MNFYSLGIVLFLGHDGVPCPLTVEVCLYWHLYWHHQFCSVMTLYITIRARRWSSWASCPESWVHPSHFPCGPWPLPPPIIAQFQGHSGTVHNLVWAIDGPSYQEVPSCMHCKVGQSPHHWGPQLRHIWHGDTVLHLHQCCGERWELMNAWLFPSSFKHINFYCAEWLFDGQSGVQDHSTTVLFKASKHN